jgi:hypothetical protein
LSCRRANDILEAEFEGKSKGSEFKEFLKGIDDKLSAQEKVDIWIRQSDLEQSKLMYTKVDSLTMFPPPADVRMFNAHATDHSLIKAV